MLSRLLQIRDELMEVEKATEGDLVVDTGSTYLAKVGRFVNMFAKLGVIKIGLQVRGHILTGCRGDLDMVLEGIFQQLNLQASTLYQSKIPEKYIAPRTSFVLPASFESGLI